MADVSNYDIYDAVFFNIKGIFLKSFDYVHVKSKSVSESESEDENLTMTETADPVSRTNLNNREQSGERSETVRETVERMAENDAVILIRKQLDERFPYALGSACGNLAQLDRDYRLSIGAGEQAEFSQFMVGVDDAFPLSERFAYACVLYVTSTMLLDVDEKKSDAYYKKYASAVSRIAKEIAFVSSSTVEKYPY